MLREKSFAWRDRECNDSTGSAKKMPANKMSGVVEFEFQNEWFVTYSVEPWNESRAACYTFVRDMHACFVPQCIAHESSLLQASFSSNRKVSH